MRTLGFRTHAVLALVAAIGLIGALGRPWYAPPPAVAASEVRTGELQGPIEDYAETVRRWLGDSVGTSGWDALGAWAPVLAVLAAITAVAAAASLLPDAQGIAREALRYASLACLAIVVWKLFDQPGPSDELEPRYGAFLAVGAALMAATTGAGVASAPLQRHVPRAYGRVRG